MKIFVTGATGFIGSYFVNHALACGHEVFAHRRSTDSKAVIAIDDRVNWITKAYDAISIDDLAGCSAVVHLAATGVTPKPATWEDCFAFNTLGSMSLMQKVQSAGIKRFISSGSYAEYGKAGLRYDPIPTDAPLEPTDPYAASKAASSIALSAFARVNAMQFYYGRIFSAYGEGQSESNFWPQLRAAAIQGKDFEMTLGEQIRDFIPVENVAQIFLHACIREDLADGEPMIRNVASGTPISLLDFAAKTWHQFAARGNLKAGAVPYRAHEVMRYIPHVVI